MKKLILLLVALVLLVVLVIVYVPFTPSQTAKPVGADRDAHGCIASAGYTYSIVRGGCIRVWEEGTALIPVIEPAEGPGLAAYAVQGVTGQEVEVFMPGMPGGLVMTRDANADTSAWAAAGWMLTNDPDQGWKLTQDGQLIYASMPQ